MYKRLISAVFLVGLFVFSGCESKEVAPVVPVGKNNTFVKTGPMYENSGPVFRPNEYDPKDKD